MNSHSMCFPLISVITISYNKGYEIEETLKSVVNQTYPNIEYIVVDGGSKDNTVEIITKYESGISKWVSEPDKGIYNAMNKGINMSTGEWIMFINSGDKLAEDEILTKMMERADLSSDIIYGDIEILDLKGSHIWEAAPIELITKCVVFGHPSTIIRNSLMKQKMYDESYKRSADYNFFYLSYKEGHKFQHIPLVISIFEGVTGLSNSSVGKFDSLKIRGEYNLFGLTRYYLKRIYRKYIKS